MQARSMPMQTEAPSLRERDFTAFIKHGAAGVHSCGILRRLEWRWGVVSSGVGNSLGTGWCVSVSQPPAEVCLTDLAWDYPGVSVQVNAFIHSSNPEGF